MKQPQTSVIDRLDAMPVYAVLASNAVFGLFTGLAHGGALLVSASSSSAAADAEEVRRIVVFTLPLTAVFLGACVLAFFSQRSRTRALALQASLLLVGALALTVWAIRIVLSGPPARGLSWTPGLFTGIVTLSVYEFRRFILGHWLSSSKLVRFAHVGTAVSAAVVELGVLYRAIQWFLH